MQKQFMLKRLLIANVGATLSYKGVTVTVVDDYSDPGFAGKATTSRTRYSLRPGTRYRTRDIPGTYLNATGISVSRTSTRTTTNTESSNASCSTVLRTSCQAG